MDCEGHGRECCRACALECNRRSVCDLRTAIGASVMTVRTATELVWDSDGAATAISGAYLLPAGPCSAWSPPLLLATAAGTSLFATLQQLARDAGVPLLGYVAQHRPDADHATGAVSGIVITACISVASEAAAAKTRAIWREAVTAAPILRVINCAVLCESNVVVLCEPALDAAWS